MEKYGYIYLTTNLVNGKVYIGKNAGPFVPFYLGSGKILRLAIKKYGRENFKVQPMEYVNDVTELNILEIKYIAECRNYLGPETMYNITDGGEGGDTFTNNPDKEKIREKIKRNTPEWTEERRKNHSKILTGRIISDIGRKNMSVARTGVSVKHPDKCKCPFCKSKRGELVGESHPMFGHKQSIEMKDHQRKIMTGHKDSKETIEKKRNSMLGKNTGKHIPHTEKWKSKHRQDITGRRRMYNQILGRDKMITAELVPQYLKQGWCFGMLKTHRQLLGG